MGSRFGSIAILIIIAAIIGAASIIIYRLGLLGGDDGDAPAVVVSIEDGALILLGEPQNITVSVASGTPITSLKLSVDEELIAEAIPVYSADRGKYIGSLIWTPQRLGFADLRIVAVDEQGRMAVQEIRVEVTDDDARIAAALQLEVLGLAPNQQLIVGETVRIVLRASGAQAIARFEIEVNGQLRAAVSPTLGDDGAYVVSIDFTPDPEPIGAVEVVFRVVDAAGRTESRTLQINILPAGSVPGAATAQADSAPAGEDDNAATVRDSGTNTDASTSEAVALIASPADGDDYRLTPDLAIDVEVLIRNTGPLASVLLYVTPVAADGSLGSSVLIFSAADSLPASGEYRETISGLERWLTASGRYELQLVAFAADERRFDHRITISAIADGSEQQEDDEESADSADDESEDDEGEEEDNIDLALINARQPEPDAERINVTVANLSAVSVEQARIQLSLIDSHDGAVLDEARITLSLGSEESANIPLDFTIDRDVSALVVLESTIDDDTSNNTLQVTLRAPTPETEEEEQAQEEQQAEQETTEDELEVEQQETQGPQQLPDLAFHEVVFNHEGYALITIVNQGNGAADQIEVALVGPNGVEIERISRAPNAQPLPPGGAEILVSNQPHDGPRTLVLDPDDSLGESDEGNNRLTVDASQ